MSKQPPKTPREAIELAGGTKKVSVAFGFRYYQRVSNWKNVDTLPPNTYAAFKHLLGEVGHEAPPELFGMLKLKETPCSSTRKRIRKA